MDYIKEVYEKRKVLVMYAAVGVSLTLLNWIFYAICEEYMPMTLANMLSWSVTVILAFLGNKIFVFESRSWEMGFVMKEAATYLGSRGATGVVEIMAQPLLFHLGMNQSLFGVDGMEAKILVTVMVTILNYSCSKMIVFRFVNEEQEC